MVQKLPLQQKAICHLQKYQPIFSRNNVWCSPRFSHWATTFIIYTNDLPMSIKHSRCVRFADNTTIYYSSNNLDDLYNKINHDLYTVADWFRANKLTLNISKTNYVIFTKSAQERIKNKSIQLGHDTINKVTHVKFRGIIIDEMLDWHRHIDHCKNKISSGLYAINTAKNIMPAKQLKTLYYSLIHPY